MIYEDIGETAKATQGEKAMTAQTQPEDDFIVGEWDSVKEGGRIYL